MGPPYLYPTFRVNPGGILNIDIDAAGPPNATDGVGAPETMGTAPGWSLAEPTTDMRIYSTAASPFTVTMTTQLPGRNNVNGPIYNFDPTKGAIWEVVRMPSPTTLYDVQTGGTPVDPAVFAATYNPAIVFVDTSLFANVVPPTAQFSTEFAANSIGTYSLYVTYSPVPEPGTLSLVGAAAIAWGIRRRSGRRLVAK
jgi:hypothetical protein